MSEMDSEREKRESELEAAKAIALYNQTNIKGNQINGFQIAIIPYDADPYTYHMKDAPFPVVRVIYTGKTNGGKDDMAGPTEEELLKQGIGFHYAANLVANMKDSGFYDGVDLGAKK